MAKAVKSGVIYVIRDASGIPVYVGQTANFPRRKAQHLRSDSAVSFAPIVMWLRERVAEGTTPIFEVVEQTNDLDAAERDWVRTLRASGVPLLNATDGGSAPAWPVNASKARRGIRSRTAIQVVKCALRSGIRLRRARGDNLGADRLSELLSGVSAAIRRAYRRGGYAEIARINAEMLARYPKMLGVQT